MEALPWFWIWVVLAAALFIGEMVTVSFFMLPFAAGAVAAAIANSFGADLVIQWVLFVGVSVIALFALRPVAKRITKPVDARSGAERLLGAAGEVIDGKAPDGLIRVRVDREEWNAEVEGGGQPAVGSPIEVTAIEGTRLRVKEIKE